MKINLKTGVWADFATGEKGGDLISLYACINGISQKEALDLVASEVNYTAPTTAKKAGGADAVKAKKKTPAPPTKRLKGPEKQLKRPPKGTKLPNMSNKKLGDPSKVYRYHDESGNVLFLIARYDQSDGSKELRPWSYREDGRWVSMGWKAPRPLYNLHTLTDRVLIVEGEKAADAAAEFSEGYSVVTWPGGTGGVKATDWKPLYGKDILIWPDHDEPGRKAASEIAAILYAHCPTVKIINTQDDDLPKGFDAADCDFDWTDFVNWAKPRVKNPKADVDAPRLEPVVKMPEVPAEIIEAPLPTPDDDPEANVNIYVGDDAIDSLTFKISPNATANQNRIGLSSNTKGRPYMNHDNILRVLAADFKGKIWFDEFKVDVYTDMFGDVRSWTQFDDTSLTVLLQRCYAMVDIPTQKVSAAIKAFAQTDRRHSVRDYLKSIEWDGIPRLSEFFPKYMEAKDTEYVRAIGRNFFISMVARVMDPGCKADHMIVLEGAQGSYKSTALDIIGGDWYVAQSQSAARGNEFNMCMNGSVLVELPEMASFEGVKGNIIKDILSRRMDRYRAPYDTKPRDWPRQSIFVGTTNDDEYLNDPTGGRRYWPVKVHNIDLKSLEKDRIQFFAEAYHLYKLGHSWHEVPADLAKIEQMSRFDGDAWAEKIFEYSFGRDELTVSDIAVHALGIDIGRVDRGIQMRIASVLKQAGFKRKIIWKDNKTTTVYMNPSYSKTDQPKPVKLPKRVIKNYAPGPDEFM